MKKKYETIYLDVIKVKSLDVLKESDGSEIMWDDDPHIDDPYD